MTTRSFSPPAARPFDLPFERKASSTIAVHNEVVQLFDEFAPALRRYVRSAGLSPEAAEDVVQESFLALFRHLLGGGARDNLRGWLVRVSQRLAFKHRERLARQQRRERPCDAASLDTAIDSKAPADLELIGREQQRRVRAVVAALSERDRQCLWLRAEGLRYRDIATTLGMSLGAVAKSLARAVTRLSNAMKH